MRHEGLAVIGALGIALALAISCGPTSSPKITGDRDTCEVYCDRYLDCKDPTVAPSVDACTDDCVVSDDWSGACAEEFTTFMDCATSSENACPTFEHVGLLGGETSPCYDENFAWSTCQSRERS